MWASGSVKNIRREPRVGGTNPPLVDMSPMLDPRIRSIRLELRWNRSKPGLDTRECKKHLQVAGTEPLPCCCIGCLPPDSLLFLTSTAAQ